MLSNRTHTRLNPSGSRKPNMSVADFCATAAKAKTTIVVAAFQDLLKLKEKNGGACNYGDYTETINGIVS
jgi:hypothetical protein